MYVIVEVHHESQNSNQNAFYTYWYLAGALHIRGKGNIWADQEDDNDDDDRDG